MKPLTEFFDPGAPGNYGGNMLHLWEIQTNQFELDEDYPELGIHFFFKINIL